MTNYIAFHQEQVGFFGFFESVLVAPDVALFAERGDETVGFALALPNYNLILKRINGKLGLAGLFKFLYYARRINEIRVIILGVKPEYQKWGIETLLYPEIFKQGAGPGVQKRGAVMDLGG